MVNVLILSQKIQTTNITETTLSFIVIYLKLTEETQSKDDKTYGPTRNIQDRLISIDNVYY